MERTQSTDEATGGTEPGVRLGGVRLADVRFAGLRRRLRSRFTVDARSLAALRIALGVILLVDLIHRALYLRRFYTDAGVYPRAVNAVAGWSNAGQSLHVLSGDAWFQAALFVLAGLFAVLLVAGYRTRLVAVVSLVLLYSLHVRNPAVLNGGDRLLRVLLLVALLAPLGARWSVDAIRRGEAPATVTGYPVAALLLQPLAVFATNAALKREGELWYAGDALEVAFANEVMTTPLAGYLADYPGLLTALNWGWVGLLAAAPLLLLGTDGRARAVVALGYLAAFAGMALTLAVGLFPLVLAASVLPYLTAPFWDAAARLLPDRLRGSLGNRLPEGSAFGPFANPPVERRALAAARELGHDAAADFVAEFPRSLVTVLGVLAVLWIVLFAGGHVVGVNVPDSVEAQAPDSQRWGLYAPDPATAYSWNVPVAELSDGRTVDALSGGNVTLDPPPDAAVAAETFRHRKFAESVRSSAHEDGPLADHYVTWLCERAVDTSGDVTSVTVYEVIQRDVGATDPPEPEVVTLLERECRP